MDAQEKIYLTPLECMAASYQPKKDNTIEYTRTDAFIEKAEKWIIDNFPTVSGITSLMYAEEFKTAMKL